jgi:hypothetical protein
MDLLRLENEISDKSVLQKLLDKHMEYPDDEKIIKSCTLLIEYLFKHGNTFSNQ